jgi:hypothetical protein
VNIHILFFNLNKMMMMLVILMNDFFKIIILENIYIKSVRIMAFLDFS